MLKNVKIMSLISWLMIVGLVICNVVIIRQNLELRETVERQELEKRVQIGDSFNEFQAVDDNNKSINLVSSKPLKKILFFSSTTCPFCLKQNPYWTQVAAQTDFDKYEIFTLFNDREEHIKANEYLKQNGYTSSVQPLYSNGEILQKYKLNGTPATVIINENGVVEKSWSGLWDKTTVSEVENYFHIKIN